MQYKDMKEMTIKEWDGKPFQAYATDTDNDSSDVADYYVIVGYYAEQWMTSNDSSWVHVYPVEWNNPTPKRMTNRQLAEWLAQGNGLYKYNSMYVAYSSLTLILENENETVDEDIKVRLIGSEEWIEPTTDLLKGDN